MPKRRERDSAQKMGKEKSNGEKAKEKKSRGYKKRTRWPAGREKSRPNGRRVTRQRKGVA